MDFRVQGLDLRLERVDFHWEARLVGLVVVSIALIELVFDLKLSHFSLDLLYSATLLKNKFLYGWLAKAHLGKEKFAYMFFISR